MEVGMYFIGRFFVCGTGIFPAAICIASIIGAAQPLVAQVDIQLATVVAAASDPSALPDAPVPVAPAGSALDRSQPLSSSDSLQPPAQNPPPPSTGPSLGDLGLSPADTEGSAARQAIMDRRTHMLKVHQRLGLITVIPVAAACISAAGATPDHGNYSNTTSRDIHVALGATAVAMYAWTASYAIRAPKVSNEPARGGVKWHKYLIYVHAPGMVLTPILGAIAFNQINSGQKVHGIASAHGAVAAATAISYGAAIVAVSWPIHIKF
jgi:hypothetical protein